MDRRSFVFALTGAGAVSALALSTPAVAQSRSRVNFARGNDNHAVDGVVRGREYRDYLLGARRGQRMSVSLITRGNAYFNILPPGSDRALFIGSRGGQDATVRLPQSGDYTVRVYLLGDARDSGRRVPYTLSFTIM